MTEVFKTHMRSVDGLSDAPVTTFNINKFQTLRNRYQRVIEPTAVGCLNNGSNINSALEDLEAWLADSDNILDPDPNFACSREIVWHAGLYRIHKKLSFINGESMRGAGKGNTYLNFVTVGNGGLEFNQTGYAYEGTTTVRDLHLLAGCHGAGQPLKIIHRDTLSAWWSRMIVENVQADGKIFGDYWTDGMEFVEAWNSRFSNVYMIGVNSATPTNWMTSGFKFSGNVVSGAIMRDCFTLHAQTGFLVGTEHLEGMLFDNCAAVTVSTGFDMTSEDLPNTPLDIEFRKIHVAMGANSTTAGRGCIKVKNARSLKMRSLELYADGASGSPKCIDLNGCETVHISEFKLLKNAAALTDCKGIYQINCNDLHIHAGGNIGFFKGTGDAPIEYATSPTEATAEPVSYYQCNAPVGFLTSGVAVEHRGTSVNTSGWNTGPQITRPNQPAFQAKRNTSVSNVTGNATLHTCVFDSDVFDIGNNYNPSTGIFTAPVSGKYHLSVTLILAGMGPNSAGFLYLNTSNRIYAADIRQNGDASTFNYASITHVCEMEAGDTARVQIDISNTGGDTVEYLHDATNFTSGFSGYLLA